MLALGLLAGCGRQHGCVPAADATTPLRAAADQAIRLTAPKVGMQFRGEQVYRQAAPDHWAVCGQVAPFADDANIFVPFVAVVTTGADGGPPYRVEQHVGTTTEAADGVYIALVTDCFDGGGPASGPVQSVAPMPPLPDTVRRPDVRAVVAKPPSVAAAPARPPAATPSLLPVASAPASGSVTMRQNANLHAAPHGAPVRVVMPGTVLHVFSTAPGGWLQVGDASPWGWVHESMIDRH